MVANKKYIQKYFPGGWRPFLVSFVTSLLLVLISFVSARSENTATRKLAKEALVKSERPYISINGVEFKEGGFIRAKSLSGGMRISVQLAVSNTGRSAAQNIRIMPIYTNIIEKAEMNSIRLTMWNAKLPNSFSLGPNITNFIVIESDVPVENQELMRSTIEKIKNNEFPVPLDIEFLYTSNIDQQIEWKASASLNFLYKNVEIKYSEIH